MTTNGVRHLLKFFLLVGILVTPQCLAKAGISHHSVLEPLKITGSDTMQLVFRKISAAYAKDTKRIVLFDPGNDVEVLEAVRQGELGGLSRELHHDEKDEGLHAHIIAIDGIGFVVNINNPIRNMSHESIRRILTGEMTDWRSLGRASDPITLVGPGPEDGSYDMLLHAFDLTPEELSKDYLSSVSERQIANVISRSTTTLGILPLGLVEQLDDQTPGDSFVPVAIDSVLPDSKSLASGTYPYIRPLMILTKGKPNGQQQHFLNYVFSPSAQAIIREFFQPVKSKSL